jgi:hypothetical protein
VLSWFGIISVLLALVPVVAISPILLYIGMLIGAQAFQTTPIKHAPAIVLALTPHLAAWAKLQIDSFAALRMTPDDKDGLVEIHARAETIARNGDPNAYDEINAEFHTAIYQGTHNLFMEETARAIRLRLRPFRRAQFRVAGRLKHSWMEHDAVVRAILRGDAETAFHAMRAHVTAVSGASTEYLTILLPELLPRP